jgi:hypothetical protein
MGAPVLPREKSEEYDAGFSMRWIVASAALIVISAYHSLFNLFTGRTQGIAYFTSPRLPVDPFLSPVWTQRAIERRMISSHQKSSLWKRKDSANLFVSRPFLRIATSERSFNEGLFSFLCSNYERAFRSHGIEKVVLTEEYGVPGLAIVHAAYRAGIPSIALQHGVLYDAHPGYVMLRRLDERFVPTHLLVNSGSEKRLLESTGYAGAVHSLGCPRFDPLFNGEVEVPAELGNLKNTGRVLLWISQSHDPRMRAAGEVEASVGCMSAFLDRNPGYTLLIKLHPNEDQKGGVFAPLLERHLNVRVFDKSWNTNELIAVSDCLIQKSSTTGFEAIIQDVPLVILDLKDTIDFSLFTEAGFDQRVRSCEQLDPVVEETLSDTYKKEYESLRDAFIADRFENPGSASDAVRRFIEHA